MPAAPTPYPSQKENAMRSAGSYIKDKGKTVASKDMAARHETDAKDVAAKRAAQDKKEISHAVSEK